jgi:hypothetical protein
MKEILSKYLPKLDITEQTPFPETHGKISSEHFQFGFRFFQDFVVKYPLSNESDNTRIPYEINSVTAYHNSSFHYRFNLPFHKPISGLSSGISPLMDGIKLRAVTKKAQRKILTTLVTSFQLEKENEKVELLLSELQQLNMGSVLEFKVYNFTFERLSKWYNILHNFASDVVKDWKNNNFQKSTSIISVIGSKDLSNMVKVLHKSFYNNFQQLLSQSINKENDYEKEQLFRSHLFSFDSIPRQSFIAVLEGLLHFIWCGYYNYYQKISEFLHYNNSLNYITIPNQYLDTSSNILHFDKILQHMTQGEDDPLDSLQDIRNSKFKTYFPIFHTLNHHFAKSLKDEFKDFYFTNDIFTPLHNNNNTNNNNNNFVEENSEIYNSKLIKLFSIIAEKVYSSTSLQNELINYSKYISGISSRSFTLQHIKKRDLLHNKFLGLYVLKFPTQEPNRGNPIILTTTQEIQILFRMFNIL